MAEKRWQPNFYCIYTASWYVLMSSQGWTSWRSHHSPQPVRKSLARQWRPVLQVLPRRGSFITSQKVIPLLTTGRRNVCDFEGRNLYWDCFAECTHCTYADPTLWSEWEVNYWLDWCQSEFGLHSLDSELRCLQGRDLCVLDKDAFLALISDCTAGEILWEHLEDMRKGQMKCSLFHCENHRFKREIWRLDRWCSLHTLLEPKASWLSCSHSQLL